MKKWSKYNYKDNTAGITNEYIDKIFEPYFSTKIISQNGNRALYDWEEIITKHLQGQIFVWKTKSLMYEGEEYIGAQFTTLNLIRINKPLWSARL